MKSENYLRYPTISELSEKDQNTWREVSYGLKKDKIIPICLVCGSRMDRSFRCKHCGYDLTMEYELKKTISMLPGKTSSVVKKREDYQKQLFENALSEQRRESDKKLKALSNEVASNQKQVKEQQETIVVLKKKISSLQEENKKLKLFRTPPKIEVKPATSGKRKLSVGQVIKLGSYPYTKDGEIQPIEWKVLDVKNGKALIQSLYGLDTKRYNEKKTDITWEKCSLRSWLNKDFVSMAFNNQEQSMILEEVVKAEINPEFKLNPGYDTRDKVFLLNISEVSKYYKTDEARKCKPTPYAETNGAYINSDTKCSYWWLRSPGWYKYYAVCVLYGGSISHYGLGVNYDYIVVRPAMWINI